MSCSRRTLLHEVGKIYYEDYDDDDDDDDDNNNNNNNNNNNTFLLLVTTKHCNVYDSVIFLRLKFTFIKKLINNSKLASSLTPWNRTLPQTFTVAQLVKKLSAVYETRRLVTFLRTVGRFLLFWAERLQFTSARPVSLRSILITWPHLCLGLTRRRSLLDFDQNFACKCH
jgi:hypothetical protein